MEGSINRIDRTGLDFIALEDPKLVLPQSSRWHVFAAFGEFFWIFSRMNWLHSFKDFRFCYHLFTVAPFRDFKGWSS